VKIGITQPNYLPWLGYFDFLDQVDHWVSLDNVQLTRRSFIVRNRIQTASRGQVWLTVSVSKCPRHTTIHEATLATNPPSYEGHLRQIDAMYRDAPRYAAFMPLLKEILHVQPSDTNLARYNERIIRALTNLLGIAFGFSRASEHLHQLDGSAQDKILALCACFPKATHYLNFAGGVDMGLYTQQAFAEKGLTLLKQEYDHPTYTQGGDAPFIAYLSIVDLLMHATPQQALEVVRAGSRWRIAA